MSPSEQNHKGAALDLPPFEERQRTSYADENFTKKFGWVVGADPYRVCVFVSLNVRCDVTLLTFPFGDKG